MRKVFNLKRGKVLGGIIIAFGAAIAFAIACIVKQKEVYVPGAEKKTVVEALVCESSNPEGGLFNSEIANRVTHEVKATFKDNGIDKLSYMFLGEYNSADEAASDEATLHAYYNIYMGQKEVPIATFNPVYSVNEKALQMVFYTDDKDEIEPSVAALFFIDAEEVAMMKRVKIDELKTLYEKKNFSCIVK